MLLKFVLAFVLVDLHLDHRHPFFGKVPWLPFDLLVVVHSIHFVIVAVELEKGKAYVTRKQAEKDLYFRQKMAEADLLVKLAEAEKTRLKNESNLSVGMVFT